MPNEAVSEHVLKYRTDEASVARSIQAVENIKDTFADASKVIADTARPIRDVGKSADDLRRGEKSVDAMAAAYEHLRERAEDLKKQLDGVKKKLEENKQAFDEAANAPASYAESIKQAADESRLYGDVGSRVRDIGGAVSMVGGAGAQQAFGVGSDLLNAAEGFGRIKAELPALLDQLTQSGPITTRAVSALMKYNPAMSQAAAQTTVAVGSLAAMAGAMAAIAVATNIAKNIIDDSKAATESLLDVNQRYAEVIANGTTQEVEEAIQANEKRNRALEIEREKLQALVDGAEDVDGFSGALLDLNDALGVNLGGIEDVKNRLGELNQEFNNNVDVNQQLSQALANGATAAADALAAEQQLADARQQQAQKDFDWAVLINQMTEADLDKRIQEQRDLRRIADERLAQLTAEREDLRYGGASQADLDANQAARDLVVQRGAEADATRYLLERSRDLVQAHDADRQGIEALDAAERQRTDNLIARGEDRARVLMEAEKTSVSAAEEELRQIAIRKAELEAIKPALEDQAQASDYAKSQLDVLNDELDNLGQREGELVEMILPAAQKRKDEAAALKLLEKIAGAATDGVKVLTGGVDDLATGLDDSAERLKEFTDEQAEVDAKREIEVQRDQEDALRKRVQDLADHYVDMADLDADYYGERQDVLESLGEDLDENQQERLDQIKEYNQESRRLAEDHQDAILQIQRDTNRDYNEAARARDTSGALAALRAGEQKLDDEQATYKKEQKRRDEDQRDLLADLKAERQVKIVAAQKELRDLEQKHARERSAKERAFWEQIRREDEQRRIAATRQAQDWQREDQARQAHYGVIETRAANHNTTMQNIAQGGYAVIQSGWSMFLAGLAAAIPDPPAVGSPIYTDDIYGGGGARPGFAGGGVPPLHTPVRLGERGQPEIAEFANGYRVKVARRGPETGMFMDPVRIYTREQAQRAGTTINVSLGGLGGVQIQAASGRSLADQIGPQITALVVDALEDLVAQYDPEVAA